MSEENTQEFMKKHPPWFTLGIHPIRFAKKISEEEQKEEKEREADGGSE